jgi:hypothetical protein
MFAKFAIATTAAVLAAAIALPAGAKNLPKQPIPTSTNMSGTMNAPAPKPAPPVSLPSRPTSGTMNMPSQKPTPEPQRPQRPQRPSR